jgi:uncharacterized lipoprotein YajG
MRLAILAAIFLLAGCAHGMAVLTNPRTDQTVECKQDPLGDGWASTQVEKCVRAYEQAGYKLTGDSR